MALRRFTVVLIAVCTSLVTSYAPADGPGSYGAKRKTTDAEYLLSARDAYGRGYALIESANRLDQDAAAADNARIREAASTQARQKYEDALHAFDEAARLEPDMYEAHTYVGYANRKLGRYDRALAAYATALRVKPDYVQAIEYQGETYLGMNRFEQAKFNYLRLYAVDSVQAQKLLTAMRAWVEKRKRDSGGLAQEAVSAAEQWVAAQGSPKNPTGEHSDGW